VTTFLKELVNISSESRDSDGLEKVFNLLERKLSSINAEIKWISPKQKTELSSNLALLQASWMAKDNPSQNDDVFLICHLDTVYSSQNHRQYEEVYDEQSQKKIAYGAGVIDNKGGVVIGYLALKKLFEKNFFLKTKRNIHLLVSPSEEIGSPGFQDYFKEKSQEAEYVLGLEPALAGGNLISSRRGNRFYHIFFKGNSVHTGRDFEKAANPIEGLMQFYSLIESLRKKYENLSISLNGLRAFPFVYNMSPSNLELLVDLRSASNELAKSFHEDLIVGINEIKFFSRDRLSRGEIEWSLVDDCPSFQSPITPALEELKLMYERHERSTLEFGESRGGSDCCYFSNSGNKNQKVVDGLGPRGGAIHSQDEYLEIESLEKRSSALSEFIETICS